MKREVVNEPKELNGYRVVQEGEDIMKALTNGETVMHWEAGDSMFPLIMHMEYCKIRPVKKEEVNIGDPVFCGMKYRDENGEIHDYYMVHRCTEIIVRDEQRYFKIESTGDQFFGWTKDVYGIAEKTNIFQDESVLWS